MKKFISGFLASILAVSAFAGCSKAPASSSSSTAAQSSSTSQASSSASLKKITIGATPTPHAEILAVAAEVLKAKGYELYIKEFTDYVQPNLTLASKELDANYFQHKPYLDDFNAEKETELVSIAAIHYEPLGIYAGKTKAIADLKNGAKIAVPNDATNEARALLLLEAQGLIKLKPNAGLKATKNDIAENPKKLDIIEIEAAQLARSLQDVDLSVINGNFAIQAGLNAATDALAKEEKDSLAATTFANILVVRKGDENREDLKALADALKSPEVKKFIEEKYKGAVVAVF
ncbi:MAG TPA: metal ABC transporter substrate-binding protein [Ruminococcaceae bacterium]|nr:metal ABC transporter substrate-binding protein [Oscillospiraceae bacterium]